MHSPYTSTGLTGPYKGSIVKAEARTAATAEAVKNKRVDAEKPVQNKFSTAAGKASATLVAGPGEKRRERERERNNERERERERAAPLA